MHRRHSRGLSRQGRAVQAVLARENRLRTHGMYSVYIHSIVLYDIYSVSAGIYSVYIMRILNSALFITQVVCSYIYMSIQLE